ncbi:MAG: hypothetical protein HY246_25210, partial [Proteobacteria bacterium]|nr:hypothetical protein [Pseudomonadota bacterium]
MALKIETFSNAKGGNSFFKAIGHPLTAAPTRALIDRLAAAGPVAVYDPLGMAESFAAMHDLSRLNIAGVYVQDVAAIGASVLGRPAQPVIDLAGTAAKSVLVAAFDADRLVAHVRHLLPPAAAVVSLDAIRLPKSSLTNPRNYLDPLNFATNFAFMRDADGRHTRIVTADYWTGYGAP